MDELEPLLPVAEPPLNELDSSLYEEVFGAEAIQQEIERINTLVQSREIPLFPLLLLLFVFTVGLLLYFYREPLLKKLRTRLTPQVNPQTLLRKKLSKISLQGKEGTEQLELVLKRYLELKYAFPFLSQSASEEILSLEKTSLSKNEKEWITTFLKKASLVKFSKEEISDEELKTYAKHTRKLMRN